MSGKRVAQAGRRQAKAVGQETVQQWLGGGRQKEMGRRVSYRIFFVGGGTLRKGSKKVPPPQFKEHS